MAMRPYVLRRGLEVTHVSAGDAAAGPGAPALSVVVPCYNEEDNVGQCHAVVREIFERHLPGYELEHVFVDNCSTDGTVEILRGIAQGEAVVLNPPAGLMDGQAVRLRP